MTCRFESGLPRFHGPGPGALDLEVGTPLGTLGSEETRNTLWR
jgi:hypothetical protein